MPVAYYIIPYTRIVPPTNGLLAERTLDLNVTAPSLAGQWREVEVLGNRAIVKINAGAGALAQLDAAYKRLPKNALNDPLSDLSAGVITALRNELLDMGYTNTEINNRFAGNLDEYTLGDVLRFIATRRRKPRYDMPTDEIIYDGTVVACEDVDALDRAVS